MASLFLAACAAGDLHTVQRLTCAEATTEVDVCEYNWEGRNGLMLAAATGNLELVRTLLSLGIPWNAVDKKDVTAGDIAREHGHMEVYRDLVDHGMRSELLLAFLSRKMDAGDMEEDVVEMEPVKMGKRSYEDMVADDGAPVPYLQQKLCYQDGRLLDEDSDAVMMEWERGLMEQHAAAISGSGGRRVLNVGFGMGIVDGFLQAHRPRQHVIIEAHADVHAHMMQSRWNLKDGVDIHHGKWQDVVPKLVAQGIKFDGIFFDTYAESYEDLRAFHSYLPDLMAPDAVYSYFNGLGATNQFFYDVCCAVAEAELQRLGLRTAFTDVSIAADCLAQPTWDGVCHKYWALPVYRLPVCTWEKPTQ